MSKKTAKARAGRGVLEIKQFPAQFKVDANERIIEGYASVFGNVDSYGDIVERGAFSKTLEEMAGRIKCCFQHKWDMPIGIPLVIEEDSKGLFTRSKISATTLGNDALTLCADGVVSEMSIGYNSVRELVDDDEAVRYLQEIALFEYGPVTWGANELARVTGVKGDLMKALRTFAVAQSEFGSTRVLSASNRAAVEQTVKELQALLDTTSGSEPDKDEGDSDKSTAPEGNVPPAAGDEADRVIKSAADAIGEMLAEMKAGREVEEYLTSLIRS